MVAQLIPGRGGVERLGETRGAHRHQLHAAGHQGAGQPRDRAPQRPRPRSARRPHPTSAPSRPTCKPAPATASAITAAKRAATAQTPAGRTEPGRWTDDRRPTARARPLPAPPGHPRRGGAAHRRAGRDQRRPRRPRQPGLPDRAPRPQPGRARGGSSPPTSSAPSRPAAPPSSPSAGSSTSSSTPSPDHYQRARRRAPAPGPIPCQRHPSGTAVQGGRRHHAEAAGPHVSLRRDRAVDRSRRAGRLAGGSPLAPATATRRTSSTSSGRSRV